MDGLGYAFDLTGSTSCAPSPPRMATSRACSQRAQLICSPASPRRWIGQGPLASRRAQRPVRTIITSPAPTFTPAFFSQASRSSG